ncbi:ATP-grasp domain-containing protein [Sinomicrobium soli]|uniref:glutathione synthase n=1 Tax=Sinomicrobium sp. N-1-3-6 TaxID=2219864 RepID=UPI000DCE6DE9|nr:glutathione synthase [Sinomicrobium sp. N-1-3-6]RAV28646.1 glutathione synthase [Sinomicrobium sp. N-1-3-6]
MKIGFVLNDLDTEGYGTSVTIMNKASEMGHAVYAMDVGDFVFDNNAPMQVYVCRIDEPARALAPKGCFDQLKNAGERKEKIQVNELDVLFLRNNPTEENAVRHWAELAGIAFGRLAQQQGVLVLNDADGLSEAFIDKLYFESFPKSIKPRSVITRYKSEILQFWDRHDKRMVLKPLQGSGGKDVYLIDRREKNVHQIIDTILSRGYVIAQEYLPEVKDGDIRVLLMNGKILEENGEKALIGRVNSSKEEFRSNFKVGAKARRCELTPEIEKIIDLVSPGLIRDGLFLVGLDVVKDKLIEINVLSPGGLDKFRHIDMPDFSEPLVRAIERKLHYKKKYKGRFDNRTLATMD